MKLKVQAQHLKPGDIVGSGERVVMVVTRSVTLPGNKVAVYLSKESHIATRGCQWGKYAMIGVERNKS